LRDKAELLALDAKIKAMLPPHYANCYQDVEPISMGSAELRFGPDGKVAWDQIWTSFCHLALAGGPPHRGRLLEPVSAEEVFTERELYQSAVEEIARGIWLVTELPVLPHVAPGWVGVRCRSEAMASWLVRAVVAENVSARREQSFLYLPAGPRFRLEKEVKNVVTAIAKTCHYWTCHMPAGRWKEDDISGGVSSVDLLMPALPAEARAAPTEYRIVVEEIERGIQRTTSLPTVPSPYLGWISVQCGDAKMAVWLLRAVVVENVVVRREDDLLYLPASPKFVVGNRIEKVVETFGRACRLWHAHVDRKP